MKAKHTARITVLYRKHARPVIRHDGRDYSRTAYAIEEARGNEENCVIVVLPVVQRAPGRYYSPMFLYYSPKNTNHGKEI
jgi:hypothetical protein